MSYRIHRGRWAVFTPREFQVLQGMAAGKPSRAIARALGVKPGTVRTYRQRVWLKLQRPEGLG